MRLCCVRWRYYVDVWASGRYEMKVLNARYLIERWPKGILILFIFMYKNNKNTVTHWCSHCLGRELITCIIILIFKYGIKKYSRQLNFLLVKVTLAELVESFCLVNTTSTHAIWVSINLPVIHIHSIIICVMSSICKTRGPFLSNSRRKLKKRMTWKLSHSVCSEWNHHNTKLKLLITAQTFTAAHYPQMCCVGGTVTAAGSLTRLRWFLFVFRHDECPFVANLELIKQHMHPRRTSACSPPALRLCEYSNGWSHGH